MQSTQLADVDEHFLMTCIHPYRHHRGVTMWSDICHSAAGPDPSLTLGNIKVGNMFLVNALLTCSVALTP